ncbi:MAG: hypothetical protein E7588_07485 [Ruminococcaceae bacterium]|nr:hypothetical protein [Oscillospiraceae bacterium]
MNRKLRFLLFALVFSFMLLIGVHAQDFVISFENVIVDTNSKSVDVDITMSGNPGIMGLQLSDIEFGDLKLTKVTRGDVLADFSFGVSEKLQSPISMTWEPTDMQDDCKDGVLATLTFDVSAAYGGVHDISVSPDNIFAFNTSFDMFTPVIENGSVTISSDCKISIESVEVDADAKSVDVNLLFSGNADIFGMMLNISYDSRLTLNGVTKGTALSGDFNKNISVNPVKVIWDNVKTTSEGVLLTLSFALPEKASGTYDISVSYGKNNIFDATLSGVFPQIVNGKITVSKAQTSAEIDGEMLGAQVRTDGTLGLRFGTRVNVNESFLISVSGGRTYKTLGAVFADGFTDVTFGTLVVPEECLTAKGYTASDLTHNIKDEVLAKPVDCINIFSSNANCFEYTAVVTQIPDENAKITARAYVCYTQNGNTQYYYFDPITRSMKDVKESSGWTK